MDSSSSRSTLEILPDEILLEVCKYLLPVDILQSFVGLNSRITSMITQYRHYVSLCKATFIQSTYLYENVFPQIGSNIRSLIIDCCYSVLQDKLFIKYFDKRMSIIFPCLEKIILIAFEYEELINFLHLLHDLNHFVEIHLNNLFPIPEDHQSVVFRTLMEVNNNQLTSIIMDNESSCLSINNTDCYLNILQLQINMGSVKELPSIFVALPNLRMLDVTLIDSNDTSVDFNDMVISPLLHLIDFRLKSTLRRWTHQELLIILSQLPIVQYVSLFLCTNDVFLVDGNKLLSLLPSTVQQFHYATYYSSNMELNQDESLVTSWPSSHPVTCIISQNYLFIHTVPWHLSRMVLPVSLAKAISTQKNFANRYEKYVEQIEVSIDTNFTLNRLFGVIAQCRRVEKIIIWINKNNNTDQEEQQPVLSRLPKLSRLVQITLYGSTMINLDHFSLILIAASNLFRLDLPFDYLIKLFENQQICDLLCQRITSLFIYKLTDESKVTLNKEHIPIIASTFIRLRVLHVNLTHLSANTAVTSSEDVFEVPNHQSLPNESNQQKSETIESFSIESMLLCLLNEFKEHKLTALSASGRFHKTIETNAKQWLQDNSILSTQQFDAVYYKEINQLLIWM